MDCRIRPISAALITALAVSLSATEAVGQVPASALAKPPGDARHFTILSPGGKHGDSWSWVTRDGTRVARESGNVRGQVWEIDYTGTSGRDGMPAAITIRGVTPTGDAAESFVAAGGAAKWKSPIDSGGAADSRGRFYYTVGGPMDINAWLIERLVASPDKTMNLLPGGQARATRLTTLDVGAGATRMTVTLWGVSGISTSPFLLWTDASGKFFAMTTYLSWLPDGYAGERQRMQDAQANAMAAQAPVIARLAKTPAGAVAFTNVRLFDADSLRFLTDQTVVVNGGKIVALGPAASVTPPAGAQIISGTGMTLVPGMWDSHMHVGDDYTGPLELSMGVTSVRDPGNNDKLTIDRLTRRASGQLLFPHVYASSMIDGKGPYSAQLANIATSQAEAITLVRRAKANGFTGVKFYGTLDPRWLPATISEAHKLGLHVHGHIPHGIRPMEAIAEGYDEVTHINWVMMEAMPAEILPVDNGIMRVEGPGRYAKDVDLDGPALSAIVATMAKKGIYSDPTMVVFEALYVPENGDLSPAYAPFVGTLPPATERSFRQGGLAVPKDLTRADYRASWAKMVGLLARMHKAGVPIVAGTDGSGIEIVRELEIYREAGFTPAEALATATIVPARLVGQDEHTGSIAVGKTADLVLVEGDPSQRIGDLRHTRVVMLDGKLLDADELRRSAGYSGRPK